MDNPRADQLEAAAGVELLDDVEDDEDVLEPDDDPESVDELLDDEELSLLLALEPELVDLLESRLSLR